MIVAFRADASSTIGFGHVVRCGALAHELSQRGVDVRFVSRELSRGASSLIENAGTEVTWIPREREAREDADADETATVLGSIDWMVVDHYALGESWERRIRERCADRLLVIDDLPGRVHDADLLVDQNLDAPDRRHLLPAGAQQLLGPMFALLRPEFHRVVPLERSKRRGLLVFLGGGDDHGLTTALTAVLLERNLEETLEVVTTSSNSHLDQLRELADRCPGLRIHVDTADMATLMARAELMIGAAGSTSWERCAMGLPALTLSVAKNQEPTASAVARHRASIHAGSVADVSLREVADIASSMLARPSLLARMGARARRLCDGRGVSRVADALSVSSVW